MNTQGVGSRDAWAQFVRLAQEARTRNQGLSAGVAKHSAAQPTGIQGTFSLPPARGVSFATGEPKVKAKVVGGLFDAYA